MTKGKRFLVEDLGVHVLDVARFLFGEVSSLSAKLARVNPHIAGEDVATMLLAHGSGVTSVVDCSFSSRYQDDLFPQALVVIEGQEGSLPLGANYQLTVTDRAGRIEKRDLSLPLLSWASRPWHNVQEGVLLVQKHWVESLSNAQESATAGRDNLKTLALVEAAYESAATGMTVWLEA